MHVVEPYARLLAMTQLRMEHGDFSIIEHCIITADMIVDRGLSHELVRHCIAAYTQESTRNYGKRDGSIDVVLPVRLQKVHEVLKDKKISFLNRGDKILQRALGVSEEEATFLFRWYDSWMGGAQQAENHYLNQLNLKVPPEEARDMLPHCLAVRMVATHNLRGWRHLMIMRTTAETHRKLQPLMGNLLTELKEKVPILFDDLIYNNKQSENLKKGR
jgi:thymidylate synthase (FAD)